MGGWPTEDERDLGDAVRKLLERQCDSAEVRAAVEGDGISARTWQTLVEAIGVPGLAVGEQHGGSGADVGALAALAQEVGRRAAPVPYLSTVLTADLLAAAGSTAEKELAALLGGASAALVFALDGTGDTGIDVAADGTLSGVAHHVGNGENAAIIVVAAGGGCFLLDGDAPGLTRRRLETLDLTQGQASLYFDAVPARRLELDDSAARLDATVSRAAVLVAAEQLGGARWCLETAAAHAKVREQFGVPIGSFQAIKHALADVLVHAELTERLVADAVGALREDYDGPPQVAQAAVHAASVAAAELGMQASATAIQVLGGVGFTWEHDVHFYFRRARASAQLTGSPSAHKLALAPLLLTGSEARTRRAPENADVAGFAAGAAAWLAANARPQSLRGPGADEGEARVASARAFQRALYDAGLAGLTWPREFGGAGLGPEFDLAFAAAARGRDIYNDIFGIGLGMCAPVLMTLGTPEQQSQLGPMLRGQRLWCQLFSEPGSGSDLASLRTRAERADDGSWVVDGDKVWTTYAHQSDFGLLLARTDPDVGKHRGLSMFILDMHAEGVDARPLRQMTGDSEFNEVHLERVRLPADAMIGAPGDGWKAALTMLMNERVTLGRDPLALASPVNADRVRELVTSLGKGDDPTALHKLSEVWVLQRSLELLGDDIATSVRAGEDPGPFASIGKLGAGQLAVMTAALATDLAGLDATAWEPDAGRGGLWAYGLLHAPALSIAGGTSEIQKNIIGERLLGLPR